MKKLILVLAIALIASPALAVLDVNLAKVGSTIEVYYTGADANIASAMPRAFALDLTIDGTGTFDSFVADSYKVGESNTVSKGYGIYPATIDIDSAGVVTSNGTPMAAASSPGTTDQVFSSSHIVLEFGSLYYGQPNAPPSSGILCVLNFTAGTATEVTMVDEDTYRGGLVFEDGSLGEVDVTLPLETAPGPATNGTPTGAGVALATNLGWTAGPGATSHDVYFGTDTATWSMTNVVMPTVTLAATKAQGKIYYCRVVAKNGVGSASPLDWSFNTDCLKTTDTMYNVWKLVGSPDCFCYKRQCRGDGNGQMTLSKPVILSDLTNLQAGYNLKYTSMKNKFDINGVHILCGDYNHAMTLSKPVILSDLQILQTYYNLKYTQGVPLCSGTNINFWMN